MFATELQGSPQVVAEKVFGNFPTHAGRGSHVIEFVPKQGVTFELGKPGELFYRGTLRFGRQVEINFAGPNPYWGFMSEVRVTNPAELFLLQRARLEAKLPRLANDAELAASPIVAALAERVTAACRDEPELASISDRWRNLSPTHSYWRVAISRALADQDYLRKADRSKLEEYVRWLLAPFRNDEPTIEAFLAELENIFKTRRWYHLWVRTKNPFHGGVAFLREREDGSFVALDADHNEITTSKERGGVGEVLLERGLEPFGYFVEEAT